MLPRMGPATLVHGPRGPDTCSASGRIRQSSGRPALQEGSVSSRVVTSQRDREHNIQQVRETPHRPVRISGERSSADVLLMESSPVRLRSGCLINPLVRDRGVRFSSHPTVTLGPGKSGDGSVQDYTDCTVLAKTAMVPQANAAPSRRADTVTNLPGTPIAAQGVGSPPRSRNIPTGSVAGVRRSLRNQGLSKTAARLVSHAVRDSTRTVYKCRFEEFIKWCTRKKHDPFHAPLKLIANFLGRLFRKGLSYSTICGYRSAISSYHSLVDGVKVGEHPTLIKLLKGVFNLRPPTRTLTASWDLEKVLTKLRLPPFEPLTTSSIKLLTLKTAFLVALATAGRSSDLHKLGCKEPYMRLELNSGGLRFVPRRLRKQDRAGHLLKDIFVPKFTEDRKLDPVRAVRIYIKRVEDVRGEVNSLFVTFGAGAKKSPTSQTIANWLRQTIELTSNNGPQRAKAHFTRAASASKALWAGVSLDNILKAADWSSDSTFARHYLQALREEEGAFGRAVLRRGDK